MTTRVSADGSCSHRDHADTVFCKEAVSRDNSEPLDRRLPHEHPVVVVTMDRRQGGGSFGVVNVIGSSAKPLRRVASSNVSGTDSLPRADFIRNSQTETALAAT